MKKIIYFTIILILTFSTCSCTKKEQSELSNKPVATHVEQKQEETIYIDDNNITIGLYTRDSSGYHYIENDIYIPWYQYKDIIVFKTLATHDTIINKWYMQDVFPSYWNKYNNNNYKIGYNLSYTTDNGDFSWNIINPEDRLYDVFNFVQLYTYDDVTPAKGSWYDHLDNKEITDGILMTSIKLTGSTNIYTIHSPMKLTVFTYNGPEDFDPKTGNYRGNSYHTINIYKSN